MIKKMGLYSLIATWLCSCNPSENKNNNHHTQQENIPTKDTATSQAYTTNNQQLFQEIDNKVIFLASGTEPGWILTLYKEKFLFVHHYGQDTIIDKLTSTLQVPYSFQSDKLSFSIDKKNCIAISGDTLSYLVKIKYQGKELIGCGKMMK